MTGGHVGVTAQPANTIEPRMPAATAGNTRGDGIVCTGGSWPTVISDGRQSAKRGAAGYFAVGIANSGPLGVASGQRSMMDFWRV
jgi:hypothetical protein